MLLADRLMESVVVDGLAVLRVRPLVELAPLLLQLLLDVLSSLAHRFHRMASENFSFDWSDDRAESAGSVDIHIELELLPNIGRSVNMDPNDRHTCSNDHRATKWSMARLFQLIEWSTFTFFEHAFPHDLICSFSSSVARVNLWQSV